SRDCSTHPPTAARRSAISAGCGSSASMPPSARTACPTRRSSRDSRRPRSISTARCSPISPCTTPPRSSAWSSWPSSPHKPRRARNSGAVPLTLVDSLRALREEALAEASSAADLAVLEAARVKYLGRKGALTGVLRGLKDLGGEERGRVGAEANAL